MSVRFLTTAVICVTLLCLMNSSMGVIYEPRSYAEAIDLLEDFKHNLTTIVFIDPAVVNTKLSKENAQLKEESKGFLGTLFGSVTGMFTSREKSISDLIYDMGQNNIVIEIDATDSQYTRLTDMYNVQSLPFILLLKGKKVMYKGAATGDASDKVKSIITAYNEEFADKDKDKPKDLPDIQNTVDKNTTDVVVNIAPGKASFKATSQDDQFLFDTNKTNTQAIEYTEKEVVITPVVNIPVVEFPVVTAPLVTSPVARVHEYPVYASDFSYPRYGGPINRVSNSRAVNLNSNQTYQTYQVPARVSMSTPRSLPETNRTARVVYTDVITEKFVPEVEMRDRYVGARARSTPTNTTAKYVPTPFGYKANDAQFDRIDERWKNILEEEGKMVDEIKKIYDDDAKLSDTLKESEEEIHESEELFYKAKNAIDKTLQDSENQMLQYERELDKLYRARQSAIRARDDLYHPYPNAIPTNEGFIQQRMGGPYKVIVRPGGPKPDNYNFHSMYDSMQKGNTTSTDDSK